MILDRDKEKKDHGKTTQIFQLPNDLCGKLKNLDLKSSEISESIDNFSKMKNKLKMKNNFEDDTINKIGEKFSNIKIVDEHDKSPTSEKLTKAVVLNIVCDNAKIQDQEVCKKDCNVSSDKDRVLLIEKEKPVDVGPKEKLLEEKDSVRNISDPSSIINSEVKKEGNGESKSEITEVSQKAGKNSEVLCSRGPVPHKIYQQQYQPYDKTWTSHVLHSGGKVRVAEPVGQTTVNNYQHWNDIPNLNIIQSGHEQCTPPVQKSYLPVTEGQENINISDEETIELMMKMLSQNPVIKTCCDILTGNDVSDKCAIVRSVPGEDCNQNMQDEGLPSSPSCGSERSPPGSPNGTYLRPPCPPSDRSDSGVESPTYLVEYPRDECFVAFVDGNDGREIDRTTRWVESTQNKKTNVSDLTQGLIKPPEGPKLRPILPKPIVPSAKTKFQNILEDNVKLRAWAHVQALSENKLITGDEADGDTELMIAVSNKFDGHLELIYALVERMRQIPDSLAIRNKAGQSALYLACKVMPEQPLVAAYIAEALLEQNVDLTSMTYECGLTLPQILKSEGDTHDAVRRELLALKDSCGKFVFQSYHQNDVNGNN